jgi:hypothetical protein
VANQKCYIYAFPTIKKTQYHHHHFSSRWSPDLPPSDIFYELCSLRF